MPNVCFELFKDNFFFKLKLQNSFFYVCSQYVNFLAKVSQPNLVEVVEMQSAGNNLDVNQYNQTVELINSPKFSHMFV